MPGNNQCRVKDQATRCIASIEKPPQVLKPRRLVWPNSDAGGLLAPVHLDDFEPFNFASETA